MSRYVDRVRSAVVPLTALSQQILGDLDMDHGGVSWWCDALSPPCNILISDYLLGLADSTEGNLAEAAMHAQLARELWYADGYERRNQDWTQPYPRGDRAQNRRVESAAHVGGFFRALGSVLDNCAGIVIGVAGLSCDIVRADILQLRLARAAPTGALPEGNPGRAEQIALTNAVRSAVDTSPPGWLDWILGMRNTLVHRARRLNWELQDDRRADRIRRPFPRNPDQTHTESLARASSLVSDLLQEDATDTIDASLLIAVSLVRNTATAASALWQRRRGDPDLIVQPVKQWPRVARGAVTNFSGFQPTPALETGTVMFNPDTAKRFEAAQLLDGARDKWATWMAAEQ